MQNFKKEQINKKLNKINWEIPQGIPYTKMLDKHAVRCTKCGWVQLKRLDNLLYRQEECPMCGMGVFDETLLGQFQELQDAVNDMKAEFVDSLKRLEGSLLASTPQAKAQKQNTTDLKSLFKRYIAKKGIKLKGRKLQSDEWFNLSHELAEELMMELAWDEKEFTKWETFYTELLAEHPTKQGQDIILAVIPASQHGDLRDAIAKRMVKI